MTTSHSSAPARGLLRAVVLVGVLFVFAGAAYLVAPRVEAQQNPQAPAPAAPAELHVLPVQGNISMIVGDGGNITISVGEDGVLLVDTGLAANGDKLLEFVRTLAPGKPLRYIINTHVHADHTGGNEKLGPVGSTIAGGNVGAGAGVGASIIAHENVLNRMSAPVGTANPTPIASWPTDTYFTKKKELYFNGESIVIEHEPNAHTDGDSFVYFRKSDVVSAGDIYVTTLFPIVDTMRGGNINGIIDALNRLIDITIPKDKQEGGTYVIPGHGRLSDEADVVEYRDMATIIRDRIADAVKKGRTLQQVKDSKPVLDYEGRYGSNTGFWTTDAFVTAVYNDLSKAAAAAKPAAPAKTATPTPKKN
jgi:glyoxylase-like metal-dependent hydrolase (beta-lactamase superfamily II)